MGLPEVTLGYIPSAGGTQTMPRHIPPAAALHLILTGDRIDAATAHRWGLLHRVVPRPQLYPEAEALARRVLSHSALAVRLAKRAVTEGLEMALDDGLALESRLAARALASADVREGLAASRAGRPPRFTGA